MMNIVKGFALANIQSVSFCQKLINIIDATNKELSMIRLEEHLSPNRVLGKRNDIKIKAMKDKIRFLQGLQQGKERQEERRVRDGESIATYNEQVLFELLSQVDKTKDGRGFRERQLETMMRDDEARLELAGQLVPALNINNPKLSDEIKEQIVELILQCHNFELEEQDEKNGDVATITGTQTQTSTLARLRGKFDIVLPLTENPELKELGLTQGDLVTLMRAGVLGEFDIPNMLNELEQLKNYNNEVLEKLINNCYDLIDTDEAISSVEGDNLRILLQLDAYLSDYFLDIIKQSYGDKYQETELWKTWTSIAAGGNYIKKMIFKNVLGEQKSIDPIRKMLLSVKYQMVTPKTDLVLEDSKNNSEVVLEKKELDSRDIYKAEKDGAFILEIREQLLKKRSEKELLYLSTDERKANIKVNGMGLLKMATRLGIDYEGGYYSCLSNKVWYKFLEKVLGKSVYDIDSEFSTLRHLDQISLEEIREEILKGRTEKEVLHLHHSERLNLNIFGYGMNAIVRKIGIEGNIANSKSIWYAFVEKLFGKTIYEIDPNIIKENELTIEIIREALLVLFTYDELLHLTTRERIKLKVRGMGLLKIAAKLGMPREEGDPRLSNKVWHQMLEKILGKKIEKINTPRLLKSNISRDQISLEEIRKELLNKKTEKELLYLSGKERLELKVYGMGLNALGARLGINGKPIHNLTVWHNLLEKLLGKTIYEIDPSMPKEVGELTTEIIRDELLKERTEKELLNLPFKERISLKVFGLPLSVIGEKLGINGNPGPTNEIWHEFIEKLLGKKTSDIDPKLLKSSEITKEIIREALLKGRTEKKLLYLSIEERNNLNVFGLGFVAIVKKLGFEGHIFNSKAIWHEFVEKLLGKTVSEIDDNLVKKNQLTNAMIREELLKDNTPLELLHFKTKERNQLNLFGYGIRAVAVKLGIPLGKIVASSKSAWYDFIESVLGKTVNEIDPNIRKLDDLTQEVVRNKLLELMTENDLLNIDHQRKEIKIFGWLLYEVARRLGIEGDMNEKKVWYHFLEKVLGKTIEEIKNGN